MPRALAIVRRLRTSEAKKLREIARFADSEFAKEPADVDAREVQLNLDQARAHFERISELDDEILSHADLREEDLDREMDSYEVNRTLGLGCIAKLSACLPRDDVRPNVAPTNREPESSPSNALPPEDPLPTCNGASSAADVTPEPFDGNRLQFRSFMAQFQNWIDRKRTLTPLDKLIVLRKHLRGEAKSLIDSLEIKESNYSVAVGLLKQAFGQVDIERQQIMSSFFNLPRVRSPSDLTNLRSLLNTVQSSVQRMEALGAPLAEYALAIEPALHASVPHELIFDFAEATSQSTPDSARSTSSGTSNASLSSTLAVQAAEGITSLIDYLRRYASHREKTSLILHRHQPSADRETSAPHKTPAKRRAPPATRSTPSTVSAIAQSTTRTRTCFFCKQPNHKPSQCTANLGLKQRTDILDKLKRCHRCFRFRHEDPSKCPGPREECGRCKSREHYAVMHPDEIGTTHKAVAAVEAAEEQLPAVLLHTASAFVVHGRRRIPIRIFLDSGSSLTFVSPNLISLLSDCKPVSSARLGLTSFSAHQNLNSRRFELTLQSTHDSTRVTIQAFEYDFMVDPAPQCSAKDRQLIEVFAMEHPLADSALAFNSVGPPVSLLIGRDQFFKIAKVGVEKTLEGSLVARGSILGWIIGGATGPQSDPRPELIQANVHCCVASVSGSARDLERLWTVEAIGVESESASSFSSDELEALRQFKEGLQYDGKAYTVSMPKRPGIERLRPNLAQAVDRLRSKLKGLRNRPAVYAKYHQEIMTFVDQGHAEEIVGFSSDSRIDDSRHPERFYVMPHHSVVTPTDQGEKWRIVFDCSSSARGCGSLNSFLLPGPDLNPDMISIVLNFRLHAIALSADIARAYLCINLSEADRPLFRFLWQGPEDESIRCYQMRKVTWGAAPSGFLLAATIREHFSRLDPDSELRVGESLYHDDLLRSFPTVDAAQQFTDTVRSCMRSAGMQLAKWKTNSRSLAAHLTRQGISEAAINLDAGKLLKVLGISWCPAEDTLQFALDHIVREAVHERLRTKRQVLRLVASIYDPLGWLAPFLIRGKLLLRDLWATDLKWDDPLDTALATRTLAWAREIPSLSSIRIPRCIAGRDARVMNRHLHLFGDASPLAFAAVGYLQSCFEDGTSETSIIMSKTRVAPRLPQSLPRLELMAALLCVRLGNYITSKLALPVDRVTFYTDSTVTYYWCISTSVGRWKTFVANRVSEIQASSSPEQWYHLPGSENIADLATRGISAEDLCRNPSWWRGPAWLNLAESNRPISQPGQDAAPSPDAIQSETRNTAYTAAVVNAECRPLIDIRRFGTLGKALRVVEYVFEAIRRMRERPSMSTSERRVEATNYLIRCTQREFFPREVEAASVDDDPPRKSKLAGFKLFLDADGLMRVKTRLHASSNFTSDEKTPIVIPGESHLASLLIVNDHRMSAHLGVSTILASLRRRYWITRARQRIKSILGRCIVCRKQHGSTLRISEAPLPESRLSPVVPFQTAGVDFCGPFRTRRGSDVERCYIALFSCATVRAVHLELVPAMTTAQTHLALRRFLSLYPECTALISDNARSLLKAAADIKQLFNSAKDPEVRALLVERGLEWKFLCPRASWMAGFYERVVGTVKAALKRTLGRSLVSFEELRTIVAELAAAVNARPLTYVSSDPDDMTPLTPSHFLRGAPRRTPLCTVTTLDELGQERMRSEVLKRTSYYRSLVARWRGEYITQLRNVGKTAPGGQSTIKIGDVCLLRDDSKHRSGWNLVRVQEAHQGRDGNVRTYTVRFSNGYEARRAAQMLCPLEVVRE